MDIRQAFDLFVMYRQAEGISPNTITWFAQMILQFADYLPSDRRDLASIKVGDVAGFLTAERARGLKPTSLLGRYKAISAFFEFAETCDELGNPPSPMWLSVRKKLPAPRLGRHDPRRARVEDVQRLIDSIPRERKSWYDARNRCLLLIMYDSGLRLGEVTNLSIADVDIEQRRLHVRGGKGDKDRSVPFSMRTAGELLTYLALRPTFPSDRLFLNADGHGLHPQGDMTPNTVRQLLKRLCREAGLPYYINPHSIRHMFATKALNDGIRLEVVSKIMGHTSTAITEKIYAHLMLASMQAEYDENWRDENWKG